jgi:hypothetical protein
MSASRHRSLLSRQDYELGVNALIAEQRRTNELLASLLEQVSWANQVTAATRPPTEESQ